MPIKHPSTIFLSTHFFSKFCFRFKNKKKCSITSTHFWLKMRDNFDLSSFNQHSRLYFTVSTISNFSIKAQEKLILYCSTSPSNPLFLALRGTKFQILFFYSVFYWKFCLFLVLTFCFIFFFWWEARRFISKELKKKCLLRIGVCFLYINTTKNTFCLVKFYGFLLFF